MKKKNKESNPIISMGLRHKILYSTIKPEYYKPIDVNTDLYDLIVRMGYSMVKNCDSIPNGFGVGSK